MAITPNGYVYVANQDSHTVSVISIGKDAPTTPETGSLGSLGSLFGS